MRHPKIFDKIIQWVEMHKPIHIVSTASVFSVASTLLIVSVMSVIFHGRITIDYLITGAVASFIVSSVVTYTFLHLLTELRKRNEKISRAEEHYHTLLNSIRDCICILSPEGRILDGNDVMRKINEADSVDELIGKSCYEFITDNIEDMENAVTKAAQGETVDVIYSSTTKKGDKLWWASRLTPIRDKDGSIKNILRISRDVTKSKQAENQLKETIENLEQMRIASLNIMEDLIHEVTIRKKTEDELKEKTAQIENLASKLELRVNEEIQKRMEKEQLLIHQSRLAAMGEMISAIAHQWRQPLNAVGLIIQDIKDAYDFGELNDDYLNDSIKRAMNQIHFMSKTIDDFRNFFRPDKEKVPFDLKMAAADVLSMLSAQLKANNISYRLTCHEHNRAFEDFNNNVIPCDAFNIIGYQNEIKQVFLNLINNAKDAILDTRERGIMTAAKNGLIAMDFENKQDKVIVRITDNGGGIPDDIINKIFEPYFTTKEHGRGTGIGLYMSKVIVEQNMGGKLSARNINGGAEFTIELPVTPPPPENLQINQGVN